RREWFGRGAWPPIFGADIRGVVWADLDGPARREKLCARARRWLGSGLYLCGRCASQKVTSSVFVQYGVPRYRQYRCRTCYMARAADPVDRHVEAVIVARLRRDDLRDLLAEKAPDVAPLRSQARALRRRIEVLAEDLDLDERAFAARDA